MAQRVTGFAEDVSDFGPEDMHSGQGGARFQRDHPQLFWLLTDRKMVRDRRLQQALGAMLTVKEKVRKVTYRVVMQMPL